MEEESNYRTAVRLGARRAVLHWLRASYEVIAGVGAFLEEVAHARRDTATDEDDEPEDAGPVRIELD
jgi:hypothetical protein